MGASERSDRDRRSGRELNPGQRVAAIAALVLAPAVLILALTIVVTEFPRGLIVLGCVVVAIVAALYGLMRTGFARLLGLGVALVALIAQGVLLITDGDHLVEAIAIVARSRRGHLRREDGLPSSGAPAPGARSRTSGAALQPEVGRRQGRALLARRRGGQARHRVRRAHPRCGPGAARQGRGCGRRRRAGDGGRRRVSGGRRIDCLRAGPALRLHSRRHPKPLCARSRGRPRRRRRRAGRARRGRRAPRGPRRGQRSRLRQQRLPGALRRGGAARRIPRREDSNDPEHGPRGARPRQRGAGPGLDRAGGRAGAVRGGALDLEQPLPARPRGRLGHPAQDRRGGARGHRGRRATGRRLTSSRGSSGASGPPPNSTSIRAGRSRPESTARR